MSVLKHNKKGANITKKRICPHKKFITIVNIIVFLDDVAYGDDIPKGVEDVGKTKDRCDFSERLIPGARVLAVNRTPCNARLHLCAAYNGRSWSRCA